MLYGTKWPYKTAIFFVYANTVEKEKKEPSTWCDDGNQTIQTILLLMPSHRKR